MYLFLVAMLLCVGSCLGIEIELNNETLAGVSNATITIIESNPNSSLSNPLLNNNNNPHEIPVITIAGLYDLRSFPGWPEYLLNFTIQLLNNHSDGWHDDVLTDAILDYEMGNSGCDPDLATRAYLNLTRDQEDPPHAILGCRCSGASMAVARLASVENILMLSPASTSVKLSDKAEYSTFSRLAAPDNDYGQVGALVKLLRRFGWNRISLLVTDTQFTKDIALELSSAWRGQHDGDDPFEGEIAYTDTIKLDKYTDEIDKASVMRILNAVPTDNPSINARVIVLFAHHQHAFPILEVAKDMNFQPDTIWVGTSEWAGRFPKNGDTSWMPSIPGFLGLAPFRNLSTPIYRDYLSRLQAYERLNELNVTDNLLDWAADRIVDGTVALAKAFSALPPEHRRDGLRVARTLRNLTFEGLSGRVAFNEVGDWADPIYSVVTLSSNGTNWTRIGTVSLSAVDIDHNSVCWAQIGCNVDYIPSDDYPLAKELLPFWVWIIVAFLGLLCLLFYQQRVKNRSVTQQLRRIESELKALDSNDDAVRQKKGKLYVEIASLLGQPTPEHWTDAHGLVQVPPAQQEYWDVLEKLRETMNDDRPCHLSSLWRVQNLGVWSYYVFRKNQLANKYGTDLNDTETLVEVSVWHGTSSLNPDVIYRDQQDGFMMQLSQQGHWGRGIYFSERAGYSDPYAFKPLTEHIDTPAQDRELFFVKLLVGESIFLDRNSDDWMQQACKNLVTPPDNPDRPGLKYDTVAGVIDDEYNTKVYVVYENGRAYPEYLVRYYKGERDETRTPFASLEEALADQESRKFDTSQEAALSAQTLKEGDDPSTSSHTIEQAVWEYEDVNRGWIPYKAGHQIQIEEAYQRDATGATTIENFPWTYVVDLEANMQTNLDHPDKKSRKIRRITLKKSTKKDVE